MQPKLHKVYFSMGRDGIQGKTFLGGAYSMPEAEELLLKALDKHPGMTTFTAIIEVIDNA